MKTIYLSILVLVSLGLGACDSGSDNESASGINHSTILSTIDGQEFKTSSSGHQ